MRLSQGLESSRGSAVTKELLEQSERSATCISCLHLFLQRCRHVICFKLPTARLADVGRTWGAVSVVEGRVVRRLRRSGRRCTSTVWASQSKVASENKIDVLQECRRWRTTKAKDIEEPMLCGVQQ